MSSEDMWLLVKTKLNMHYYSLMTLDTGFEIPLCNLGLFLTQSITWLQKIWDVERESYRHLLLWGWQLWCFIQISFCVSKWWYLCVYFPPGWWVLDEGLRVSEQIPVGPVRRTELDPRDNTHDLMALWQHKHTSDLKLILQSSSFPTQDTDPQTLMLRRHQKMLRPPAGALTFTDSHRVAYRY